MLVYEDAVVRAELAEDAAVRGHVLVRPQRAAKRLCELSADESGHLFLVASYSAAILFQGLQAQGTNLVVNEDEERLTLHVLARAENDGLNFAWKPQQLPEGVMDEAAERIRDKMPAKSALQRPQEGSSASERPAQAESAAPETKPAEQAPAPKQKGPIEAAEERENYLIKQLIRIP